MDPKELIEALGDDLDDLEEILEPLFETPLSETLSKLDPLQQAKLGVLIPYIVQDLVYGMSFRLSMNEFLVNDSSLPKDPWSGSSLAPCRLGAKED